MDFVNRLCGGALIAVSSCDQSYSIATSLLAPFLQPLLVTTHGFVLYDFWYRLAIRGYVLSFFDLPFTLGFSRYHSGIGQFETCWVAPGAV